MPERKRFVLRMDEAEFEALEKWAQDEFRSVNGQLEWLIHEQLKKAGRLPNTRNGKKDARSRDQSTQ